MQFLLLLLPLLLKLLEWLTNRQKMAANGEPPSALPPRQERRLKQVLWYCDQIRGPARACGFDVKGEKPDAE